MNNITLYKNKIPNEPGYYVAGFITGPEIIRIVDDGSSGLRNTNGASTHFSRWNVSWSEKINFVPND